MAQINLDREKVVVRTSVIGIITNFLLALGKAIVGIFANSIAIILDAVNNLSDALSSVITIVGTKLSLKPATKKHPFGYGRIEYLASLTVSTIILYAGFTSLVEACKKIFNPTTPEYNLLSLILLAVAVVTKIVLGLYVKKTGKKVNAPLLVASGTDALFDSIISGATLVAAIIFNFTGLSFEAYLGLIISLFIIKSAIELIVETVSQILGERLDASLAKEIKKTITQVDPQIQGAYDLILNNYGPNSLLGSVHIEVPADWSAEKLDSVTRKIQAAVFEQHRVFLSAVGIYSVNSENAIVAKIRENIENLAQKYEDILQLHGFYVDLEAKRISFDAVVSFDSSNMKQIFSQFSNEVKKMYNDYQVEIQMDTDISD